MNPISPPGPRMIIPPASILVFGASSHIGGPLVETVLRDSPQTRLRLATSHADKVPALRARFPGCEVVVASYYDVPSLLKAFDGMEGAFIVTPDFTDEIRAMTNVVACVRQAGTVKHIVRIMGDPPHVRSELDVSKELIALDTGTGVQHIRARRILEPSGLPITYLNITAYYMDNFLRMFGNSLRNKRTLYVPYNRHMNYIDARDVGRAAAILLLSGDTYHLGKTYNVDNGTDCLMFDEVAALMSEVLGHKITYNDSVDDFIAECTEEFDATYGPGAIHYMLAYTRWEQTLDPVWRRTDLFTSLFKFQPRSLRDWLQAQRATLL